MWLVDLNYLLICSLVRHMFKEVRMDICDNGKEIAEAEDWVKENRVRT